MQLSLKCMPNGNLPYTDDSLPTKMMTKLFEDVPYLGIFPRADENDDLIRMSFENIPGIKIGTKRIVLKHDTDAFQIKFDVMDKAYNNPSFENLEPYKTTSFFFNKYLRIINKIKPKETVIRLLGPFTMAQMISTKDDIQLLADKYFRKFLIQAVCVKAMWLISKVKELSPETIPIIMFEEPKLYQYGEVKRENEDVTKETVVLLYTKVFEKLHSYGAAVGVQCMEKCDWQVVTEAGADIISFDAYNNPNNLTVMADKINNFLAHGGYINWAIVPVMSESMIKTTSIDAIYNRFISTVENVIDSGVSERLAYNRAMVSVQGDLDSLPLIFAEKALILSTQLARKIPKKQ
ncbi:hypothetical protein IJ750_03925 [bacterium]|nr:hypothetical protein [bacterium]